MSELFLRIFNTAIMAGWLVLAVLAARLLLRKAPVWVKCSLWVIVALRLVWPADGIRFVASESTDNFYWVYLPDVTKIPRTTFEVIPSQREEHHTHGGRETILGQLLGQSGADQ